jgi:hypothetical protein
LKPVESAIAIFEISKNLMSFQYMLVSRQIWHSNAPANKRLDAMLDSTGFYICCAFCGVNRQGIADEAPKRKDETIMKPRIFATAFSSVYPLYIKKAERKGRNKEEVDAVIRWLAGYDESGLQAQIEKQADFETFFAEAPQINPNADKIKGVICGVRVEEIEDPLMRKIRCLDKLVDELSKGKPMETVLRD